MITRLADRIEPGPAGEEVRVIRYGMWGTNAEIERHGRKWFVVHPNKSKKRFKNKAECEIYLEELLRR